MLNDLRHGVRSLLREKGWTAVVVLSLALGIGANTALFSAVNGLFLKKLDVPDPNSLVRLKWAGKNDMATDTSDYGTSTVPGEPPGTVARATFSHPMYLQFRADNTTMTDLVAGAPFNRATIVIDGQADVVTSFVSTGNYYQMLGLSAHPGRTILPDDDRPDAAPVAVIGARYWRTRFGGDLSVIGKVVQLNDVLVTIVGVITPELVDLQQAVRQGPDIAVPVALVSQLQAAPAATGETPTPLLERPTYWWLQIVGRVKPGVTAAQVRANLESVFQHTARNGLDAYLASVPASVRSTSVNRARTEVPRLHVDSGSRGIYDVNTNDSRALTILMAVVVLMLLIVCANVANLLLSRAANRRHEISVRLSLGATRGRLVRQLLTESLLLAGTGGALGLVVGRWGQRLLPIPVAQTLPLDWRVLAFAFGVSLTTGLLFGIAPALRATATDPGAALKDTNRTFAGSRSLLGKALLVTQVAVSLVLLIGAGLFVRTLQNLRNVDVGFDTHNVILFRLSPLSTQYDNARVRQLYDRVTERVGALPGIESVGAASVKLLSSSVSSTSIFVQGRTYTLGQRADSINRLVVSPQYFNAMKMRLKLGRPFSDQDDATAPQVAIINETAVRRYFPNVANPIGQRFGVSAETAGHIEVVGVLADAKYDSVRDAAPPTLYVPARQFRMPTAVFSVRTAGETAAMIGAIRAAVHEIDPNLPLTDVSTQDDQVDRRLQQERAFATAYSLFGGLALLLASIGLFGLMSYSVARRTNEIGIRMALGAQREDVLTLVMGESMTLVVAGIVLGLAAAIAAGRLIAALLYGLAPTDVPTMIGAVAVLTIVSAIAGYLPARRASRVDPLVALRYE